LEAELEKNAWIRMSLDPDLLFADNPVMIWPSTIKALFG
jgi:putative AlgH/UPF0301 family transcriptional regulator